MIRFLTPSRSTHLTLLCCGAVSGLVLYHSLGSAVAAPARRSTPGVSEVLRARSLEIVGQDDEVVGLVKAADGGASVWLSSGPGKPAILLECKPDGASVSLFGNRAGKRPSAALTSDSKTTTLNLRDPTSGQIRIMLDVDNASGLANIGVLDRNGQTAWREAGE
jgi:hypothetical protein